MRRLALLIAGIALLGTCTAVAVAWALALWSAPTTRYGKPGLARIDADYHVSSSRGFGIVNTRVQWQPTLIPIHSYLLDSEEARLLERPPWRGWLPPGARGRVRTLEWDRALEFHASGWPMPCLWWVQVGQGPFLWADSAVAREHALVLRRGPNPRFLGAGVLPLRPEWVPLAINSLLFSCAWGALIASVALPAVLRKRSRRARGACLSCGYDLHRLQPATCPECGRAISSARP